jgi:hypothetical protein
MNTLNILIQSISPNFTVMLSIFGFFIYTSIIGFAFLNHIFHLKRNIIIPASIISGVYLYALFLAVGSYIFKGPGGILIITISFGLMGLILLFSNRLEISIISNLLNLKFFSVLVICLGWLLFIFLLGGNNIYGGDVIAYWGFATSFANGNYPLMSPWQPSILSNHHQGIYLYEGAIYALIPTSISLVHTLFSMLIISSGFLLLWGHVSILSKRIFLSLLCSLVFFISFGAIFIPIFSNYNSTYTSNNFHIIEKLPIFTDAKNRLGGSSNLNEIFYINHRAAAFSGLILLLVLANTSLKKTFKLQLTFLGLLAIPIISTDEVILPSLGLMFTFWLYKQYLEQSDKKNWFISVISIGMVCLVMFFIVGSALRDSILTPTDVPRFQLVFKIDSILYRIGEMSGEILKFPSGLTLYLPNLIIYFILSLITTWLIKNQTSLMILLGAIGATIAMLFVEHTFYPGNHGRFLHLVYLLLSLNIVLNCLVLLGDLSYFKRIMAIVIILLFIPALLTTSLYLVRQTKANAYVNFKSSLPDYSVLKWFKEYYPNSKILFIDGYLYDQPYSYLSLAAVQDYGLLVPLSPAEYKVHTPDMGPEYIDTILTLDPGRLQKTKAEFIYIVRKQYDRFSPDRIRDLKNSTYFSLIYSDNLGDLYKIHPKYFDTGTVVLPNLYELLQIIPKGSKIYLDYPNNFDIQLRAALWLLLKDHVSIYTIFGSGGFNLIETTMPYYVPEAGILYDYLLIDEDTDPVNISNQKYKQVWKLGQMRLYEAVYK